MKSIKNLQLVFLCLSTKFIYSQCNYICNGDFENQIFTTSSTFINDNLVNCWHTTDINSQFEFWGSGNMGVNSCSGLQFVELNSNSASTIFQDFVALPGTILTINFCHRGRWGTDYMDVEIGPVSGPYTSLGPFIANSTAWVNNSGIPYTVPSGSSNLRIRFVSLSPQAAQIGNFLDNISVTGPLMPPPNSNISGPSLFCPGAAGLIFSVPSGPPGTQYIWTIPNTGGWAITSGQNTSNITVTAGNSPGLISVQVISSQCSSSNGSFPISLYPMPIITISSSPPFICNNSQNILTASGAGINGNYSWFNPALGTGQTKNVLPGSGPVTYNVTGTSSNGCSSVGTITLNDGPIVTPIVSNQTMCTNAVTNTILTASSSFPGAVSYNWTPIFPSTNSMMGTNNLPQLVVTPNGCIPNGNYPFQVTSSSNSGCPGTAIAVVTVTDNCCSQPTTGLTPLVGSLSGNYSGTSYILENNISVSNWAKFQDAEVLIMPNVKITVPAGMKLGIEHAHLYACGIKMWQGIVIDDQGEISATIGPNGGSNLIEDAKIAIDVTGISTAHALLPINVWDVIFNRNHIGIQLSHSLPGVNSLNINVMNCVFTSRKLTFATPAPFTAASWDNTGTAFTPVAGLRYAFPSAISGLAAPYTILSVWNPIIQNLKWPYDNQPGEIGIRIEDVGQTSGSLPPAGSGVSINAAITVNNTGFNLFDGIGVGIEVTDASLITNNNVFQNMQHYNITPSCYTPPSTTWVLGIGIAHKTTGIMNALLDLRPSPLFASGNRFWDCYIGVVTQNVYDVNIEDAIFRSTQNMTSPFWHPGLDGIVLGSNRFKYNIKSNEFNNIENCIWLGTNTGSYDMGPGQTTGTYADNVSISENYLGAQVNSSTPLTTPPGISEYVGSAITVNGPGPSSWQMAGVCQIFSNKIDRAFRGIKINQMEDYPVEIGGNKIKIQDILFGPSSSQYGILGIENTGNLVVNQNTVEAQGPNNTDVIGINMIQNQGVNSPTVTCNEVHNAYIGFEFAGNQPNSKWEGNAMYEPMTYGFSLVDYNFTPGVIGPQGSLSMSSGNYWLPSWLPSTPNQWFTRCNGSNPSASILYPDILVGSGQIPNHFGSSPYSNSSPTTFDMSGAASANDCLNPNLYPAPPSQRLLNSAVTDISISDNWIVGIYPNPSNGKLTVSSSNENELLKVRIMDVTSKLMFSGELRTSDSKTIDVSSIKASLYFIEIENEAGQIVRKKLVKE